MWTDDGESGVGALPAPFMPPSCNCVAPIPTSDPCLVVPCEIIDVLLRLRKIGRCCTGPMSTGDAR